MFGNEGGGSIPPTQKRPRHHEGEEVKEDGGGEAIQFLPYLKPNYRRLYPENSLQSDFRVFVESKDIKDKLGNKSPIYLNHIFASAIKGVVAIRRVNANKIVISFRQYNTANNFITNNTFLDKYGMKAYIPAAQIERTGIIRFVPNNISNKELFEKLSSKYEIIAVRRFTKKVGQNRVPLQTVSITFLSNILPNDVQYELFSYRVFDYVPPLQQCFKCFKFNHSAKICNGRQRCSCCAGDHFYKECPQPDELRCVNCDGAHLAVSRFCPIKIKKIAEKKNSISYANTAATVTNLSTKIDFPTISNNKPVQINNKSVNTSVGKVNNVNAKDGLNNSMTKTKEVIKLTRSELKAQLVNNEDIINALVSTLVELGNKNDNTPTTITSIKDKLIKNLS